MTEQNKIQTSEIYLAGGCFWGLEAYFAAIGGVLNAESGANGNSENPISASLQRQWARRNGQSQL